MPSPSPERRKSISRERSRSRSRSASRRSFSRSRSRSRSRSFARGKRGGFEKRPPSPVRCLGVFGLNRRTSEKQLRSLFSKFGDLDNVKVITDMDGRSRGFGFVYFERQSDADEAKEQMNGSSVDGNCIRVDYSVTKKAHSPTPGVYMGKVRERGGYYRRSRSRSRSYSRGRSGGYRRRRSYSRSPSYRRRR